MFVPFFSFIVMVTDLFVFLTTPELWLDKDYTHILQSIDGQYTGNDAVQDGLVVPFTSQMVMPCQPARITSDYGLRLHPIDNVYCKHTGIDFATPWHSNIYAVADGQVVIIKVDTIFGRNITIKHNIDGQTLYSFYAHLSHNSVAVGDTVLAGQVIGLERRQPGKDTGVGKSTGHHLHFEIRTKTNSLSAINPKTLVGGF